MLEDGFLVLHHPALRARQQSLVVLLELSHSRQRFVSVEDELVEPLREVDLLLVCFFVRLVQLEVVSVDGGKDDWQAELVSVEKPLFDPLVELLGRLDVSEGWDLVQRAGLEGWMAVLARKGPA